MDYHERLYWDRQYKAGNFGDDYEWLGEVDDIVPHVLPYLVSTHDPRLPSTKAKKVLHLGCGNSLLGVGLAAAWCRAADTNAKKKDTFGVDTSAADTSGGGAAADPVGVPPVRGEQDHSPSLEIDNLDYSNIVVQQMRERAASCSTSLMQVKSMNRWVRNDIVADGLQSSYRRSSVALIVEKGLADALLCEPDEAKRLRSIGIYLQEACEVLALGGAALFFTLEGQRLLDAMKKAGVPPSLEFELGGSGKRIPAAASAKTGSPGGSDLIVLRRASVNKGLQCPKCSKKNLRANIAAGSRCPRCGCLHRRAG
eukprot:g1593.t1